MLRVQLDMAEYADRMPMTAEKRHVTVASRQRVHAVQTEGGGVNQA